MSEAAATVPSTEIETPQFAVTTVSDAVTTAAATLTQQQHDPLRCRPSPTVRDGDFVLLHFGDGRQIFAQCQAGKKCTVRINKKAYSTNNLVGLPFGTVLEQEQLQLVALPASAKLIPEYPAFAVSRAEEDTDNDDPNNNETSASTVVSLKDNRSLVDTNTAQQLDQQELWRMKEDGIAGAEIVASIIENSATFDQKTAYSKAKYVVRKQKKYQPRCRIVRCNGATICEALYLKDPRKVMNLREDTLAQILSYANVSAGCQTLVLETCMGIVTGAMARRMGGYGKILSIYSGQQPSFTDMLSKFNLSFAENASIKWLHAGDVFAADDHGKVGSAAPPTEVEEDLEQKDRDGLRWPCHLQPHTRNYIETEVVHEKKRSAFLLKRAARFARKLCRHTPQEAATWLRARPSDSIVIVARYDPTETLLRLFPHLAPSCPFVVFCEFIEPLTVCFRELQRQDLAINLRLSDTWMREYQVLEGRTHPFMSMSQSGGFILTGIKLDPETGRNELDGDLLQEIKAQIGGRRGRKNKKGADGASGDKGAKSDKGAKRRRVDEGNEG